MNEAAGAAAQPVRLTLDSDVVAEWHSTGAAIEVRSDDESLRRGVTVVVCTYRRPESLARLLESIDRQDSRPREVLVVDASPDAEAALTRERVCEWMHIAEHVRYWQVTGRLRGLTRQRNFALPSVTSDLVLFLDDDVVLQPECVREMEQAHRSGHSAIAGVGCLSDDVAGPSLLWRLRRVLGIVPSLAPGRYWRSGMSTPWTFPATKRELVDGDWLCGGAMMWRTDVVRAIRFNDQLEGYAQGEDLDFSLRARSRGRLVMLGTPRLRHCHATAGRPDAFRLGYMELRNRYEIHRRAVMGRTRRDVAWFVYAWALDTALLARHVFRPGQFVRTMRQIGGRITAATHLCLENRRQSGLRRAR